MRREPAIIIATVVILAAMVWVFLENRIPDAELRRSRRGEGLILPRRDSGSGTGLLAVTSPRPMTSPRTAPTTAARKVEPSAEISTAARSLCELTARLPPLSGDGSAQDEVLIETLRQKFEDDPEVELFTRIVTGDIQGVENADRDFGSGKADEIALIARLGLLQGRGFDSVRVSSASRTDVEQLEEMRSREPQNGFWALVEYAVKKREGIPVDPFEAFAWATTPGTSYRDPVSDFYADIRKKTLADDQAFLSTTLLYARAPILSSEVLKYVRDEIEPIDENSPAGEPTERSPKNELVYRVGETIHRSQYDPKTMTAIDGFTGTLYDALMAKRLMKRANGSSTNMAEEYTELRKRFARQFQVDLEFPTFGGGAENSCDAAPFVEALNQLRQEVSAFDSGNPEQAL
jgi:hypothetical protein